MEHVEISPEEEAIWATYQRMRVRLAGHMNRELSRHTGLSEADFEILTALRDAPDASVRALALRCGLAWEKSRLSHQLRRMEKRGLVAREECVEDNRGTVVRLTAMGQQLVDEGQRWHRQAVKRWVLDGLRGEQVQALGDIAAAILAHLGEPEHHLGEQLDATD